MNLSISQQVVSIISQTLNTPVCYDDDMNTMHEWDSMAQLSILINIESSMKCTFNLEDIVHVDSVRSWIQITTTALNTHFSEQ